MVIYMYMSERNKRYVQISSHSKVLMLFINITELAKVGTQNICQKVLCNCQNWVTHLP